MDHHAQIKELLKRDHFKEHPKETENEKEHLKETKNPAKKKSKKVPRPKSGYHLFLEQKIKELKLDPEYASIL